MRVCPQCEHVLEYSSTPPRFCSNCGAALSSALLEATQPFDPNTTHAGAKVAATATIPQSIGGYRLLKSLGSGGMGAVFEGEDTSTGRRVAVKLIRPEFADSKEAVERFRREGRLASAISHPRCVFVVAADEEEGRPYIVMELMPGETLADLVAKRGPLPVREAVGLILDVVEGLQEAHRCGLIHRDVKPSNCFIDAEGRIKVGDFGLSKSLVPDASLTQSGAFLGTLLYAAPEQIRNQPVDQQVDVYSVSGTLYFLLTGRAPFQLDDDAAATLARTFTDPITPVRQLRPEVPETLEDVILTGLSRSPDRRWKGLEELRLALLPFVPGTHSLGELGYRFVAYLLDLIFLVPFTASLAWAVVHLLDRWTARPELLSFVPSLGNFTVVCLYFGLFESLWSCTPGKYLFRLRVRTVTTQDRPSVGRGLLRAIVFFLTVDGGQIIGAVLLGLVLGLAGRAGAPPAVSTGLVLAAVVIQATVVLGYALVLLPMRRRNGYRGLHEWLTGTRTISLPRRRDRRALQAPASTFHPHGFPAGVPYELGPYRVLGLVYEHGHDRLLLGEDPALNRQVWLWLRPGGATPGPDPRREVTRTTRPRWLAGGVLPDGVRWDAFLLTPGRLLVDALPARKRVSWVETLPVLEQLAEELAAAGDEGTLPGHLGVEQVWLTTSGRVQVLDVPARPAMADLPGDGPEQKSLALLDVCARKLLEGPTAGPRPALDRRVYAPLPGDVAHLLARLGGNAPRIETVREFQAELAQVREKPLEVSRPRRSVHLSLQGALLAIPIGIMLVLILPGITVWNWALYLDQAERLTALEEKLARLPQPDPRTKDLRDKLATQWPQINARQEYIQQSSSWFVRKALSDAITLDLERVRTEARADMDRRPITLPAQEMDELRDQAQKFLSREDVLMAAERGLPSYFLAIFPLLWAGWAFLWRGGVSLRLTGLRVVQADGLPAARWRCALRCVACWLPFYALVTLSGEAEMERLLLYLVDPEGQAAVLAWVTWLFYWAAVLLLPVYVWLALRSPGRGLHDRVAGTYLMPR